MSTQPPPPGLDRESHSRGDHHRRALTESRTILHEDYRVGLGVTQRDRSDQHILRHRRGQVGSNQQVRGYRHGVAVLLEGHPVAVAALPGRDRQPAGLLRRSQAAVSLPGQPAGGAGLEARRDDHTVIVQTRRSEFEIDGLGNRDGIAERRPGVGVPRPHVGRRQRIKLPGQTPGFAGSVVDVIGHRDASRGSVLERRGRGRGVASWASRTSCQAFNASR